MSSTLLLPEQPANTVPKPAPLAKVELDDLAYLLKVAAAEATKVKRNGSAPEAIQLSAQSVSAATLKTSVAAPAAPAAARAARTCGGKSPSISISAMALPPGELF